MSAQPIPPDVELQEPGLLLTATEYAAHQRELRRLRARQERELPARMREARTFVAADANEEIAQIQDEQTVTGMRIARMEELLDQATVIPDSHAQGIVSLGCTVEIEFESSGRRASYRLTGSGAAAEGQSVSARSPVGQALMGRREGDVVAAVLPRGHTEWLRIIAIEPTMALGD